MDFIETRPYLQLEIFRESERRGVEHIWEGMGREREWGGKGERAIKQEKECEKRRGRREERKEGVGNERRGGKGEKKGMQ